MVLTGLQGSASGEHLVPRRHTACACAFFPPGTAGTGKRKRSGKQRRRGKAAAAGFEAREAQRARQAELEARTGSEGLFAVLNSIVGDSSAAQAVKEERLGMGPGAKQAHLFAGGSAGGGQGGGSRGGRPARAQQPEDRRALVQRGDELAQLRAKVKQLT